MSWGGWNLGDGAPWMQKCLMETTAGFLAGFRTFRNFVFAAKSPRELLGLVKFPFPGPVCPSAEGGVEMLLLPVLIPRKRWETGPWEGRGRGNVKGKNPVVISVPPLPAL